MSKTTTLGALALLLLAGPAATAAPTRPAATRATKATKPARKAAVRRVRRTSSTTKKEESTPAPAPAPALGAADATALLNAHNAVRAEVNVPPLAWNDSMSSYAGTWAKQLEGQGCTLAHRTGANKEKPYGENLALWTGGGALTKAVDLWHQEKANYSGGPIQSNQVAQVGHWTQVVWKATTKVGCGRATCGTKTVVVCNYSQQGNIIGQAPY